MTARIAKVLPGFVKHDRATFVPASATLLRAMLKSVVKMTALWGEELKTRDLHASIPFHSAIIEDLGHDFGGCLMWSRTTRSAGRDFFEFLNHQKRRGELFRVFHFGRKGSLALDQAEALDTKHKIEIVAEGDSGRLLSKLTAKEKRVEQSKLWQKATRVDFCPSSPRKKSEWSLVLQASTNSGSSAEWGTFQRPLKESRRKTGRKNRKKKTN